MSWIAVIKTVTEKVASSSLIKAIGKAIDFLPSRQENLRNESEEIKQKMDALFRHKSTSSAVREYERLAERLHKIERQLKNR